MTGGRLILTRKTDVPIQNSIVINDELVIEVHAYKGNAVKVHVYQLTDNYYSVTRGEISAAFEAYRDGDTEDEAG